MMNKEEIMQAIEEKEKQGIKISSVSGNTNAQSDLGYRWEYYIDNHTEVYEDDEENYYEEEVIWDLCYLHCGNGQGCFSVVDKYECDSLAEAERQLLAEALKGGVITFSDGTSLNTENEKA